MKKILSIVVVVIEMILSTICEAQVIVFKAQYDDNDSLLREVSISSSTEIFQCEVNCPRNLTCNIEDGKTVRIPVCDQDGRTPFQNLEGEFSRFFVVTLNGKTYYIENLPELNKKKKTGILYCLGRKQTLDSIVVYDSFMTFNLQEGLKYSYESDGGIHIQIPERDSTFTVHFELDGFAVEALVKPKNGSDK